ncbi:MAG: hypothetical protein KAI86_11895 [Desulfobacterales bacterium]|nr:hypothetical protein [Desulfobacterales bacterium]
MKILNNLTCFCMIFFTFTLTVAQTQADDKNNIQRGRYIAKTSGCNDCHTPGYMINNGDVPENQWLIGDTFGWRGPWGTTYGSNLRLFVKNKSEGQWVASARTLKRKPPMPWFNLNAMSDNDLRALYVFIKSLGKPGDPSPTYLPPEVEPPMPYAQFPSPPPKISSLNP